MITLEAQHLRSRRTLSQAEVDRRTKIHDRLDPTATERFPSAQGHRTAVGAAH